MTTVLSRYYFLVVYSVHVYVDQKMHTTSPKHVRRQYAYIQMCIVVSELQQICCVVVCTSDDGDEAALFEHFQTHLVNDTNATSGNLLRWRRRCHC